MVKGDLWVIFKLADSMYAVNSNSIEGIARVPEHVTTVPEAESYIRGIVKQRGKILILVDLIKALGLNADGDAEASVDSRGTMMIMMKLKEGHNLGLIVDEIMGVEQIGEVYQNTAVDKISHSELIGGVASSLDGNNLLLLIDERQINHIFIDSAILNDAEIDLGKIELS